MSNNFCFILTERGVAVYIDGKMHSISKSNSMVHDAVLKALKENDHDKVRNLINTKQRIADGSDGRVQRNDDGNLMYDGNAIDTTLSERILNMLDQGFDIQPLLNFLDNLYQNVSYRAITELYGFLSACDLPITSDGHFLAYKMVSQEYTDIYTNTMDNSIGAVVSMPRGAVDDNCNNTCSSGLHVCSQGYLGSYASGARIVVCKVNPKDVVSVPVDYNNAKMRVCEYTVVDELFDDELIKGYYENRYDDFDDDFDDDDFDDDDFDDGVYDDWGLPLR